MQHKAWVDQKASDAELIALVRGTQNEINTLGEPNELSVLLGDFARELLKRRLFERVTLVQLMELSRTVEDRRALQPSSGGGARQSREK